MPRRKIILDLCAGTGAWSRPYAEAGYDVRLVTLPKHDVRDYVPPGYVWGVLAAPPCTEFAGSGARWWKDKDPKLLDDALDVVYACLRIIDIAQPRWWAIENPVGRLRRLMSWSSPRLVFDPCDYGDPYRKRTQVWGRFNLPKQTKVKATGDRPGQPNEWYSKVGGRSEATKAYRSATPPGFARAFFNANP